MFQIKEHNTTLKTDLEKNKVSDLHDKKFKITVINMLTKVRRCYIYKVRISTEIKYIRKDKTEIIEVKNTINGLRKKYWRVSIADWVKWN